MSEVELSRPDEAALDDYRASTTAAYAQLVQLELWRMRREMFGDPGVVKLTIGAGQPAEQTILGNQQDPYNGVAIWNPTSATLSVGFQAGAGILAPLTVVPFSWARLPARYTNLSIALLSPADQQTAIATPLTVQRLRIPPSPAAGPLPPAAGGPLVSLPAGSAAVQAGAALDNGAPKANHSLLVIPAGTPTAGTVALQVSHDAANWATAATGAVGAAPTAIVYTGAFRYARAVITVAVTATTISALVGSA